jgi:hypothetical protein
MVPEDLQLRGKDSAEASQQMQMTCFCMWSLSYYLRVLVLIGVSLMVSVCAL